ncbi:hypothetical protein FAVG1_08552 [Fusarium avenaceum]|nr:hypothetical protein FAVG1_08552 [Fusarium avenaceum]
MSQQSFIQQVKDRLSLTAGLPSPHPTASYWQEPPALIATIQSDELPSVTDIAIIGSGVTGTSVAHSLLNDSRAKAVRVTILEARNACSGATGRNGGHLVSDIIDHFQDFADALGVEEAVKMLRFSEANIAELKAVVSQLDASEQDAVELRELNATAVVGDKATLDHSKASFELMKRSIEKTTLEYGLTEDQNVIKSHKNHFSIETNTPVLSISFQAEEGQTDNGYLLQTPRGVIRARKVIHCTNGYSSHLLTNLTGVIYPLRGTVAVQDPGDSFPRLGNELSWAKVRKGYFDSERNTLTTGLYYAQQNAKSGEIVIGGESQEVKNLLTSDDSEVSPTAKEHISSIIPKIYVDADNPKVKKIWSGIMGFTPDGLPLIGNLGKRVTGREGTGEWIAAGFNGHGMDKCWLSGQAVARMVLGEDVPPWLPRSFLADDKRLQLFTLDKAVEALTGAFAGSSLESD